MLGLGGGVNKLRGFGSRGGGGADFSISNSFLLDKAGEYISVPNADLAPVMQGSNKSHSIFFIIKRTQVDS